MTLQKFAKVLEPSLRAQDWSLALVTAWRELESLGPVAVAWSQQSRLGVVPNTKELQEWLLREPANALALASRIQDAPCSLLTALDGLAFRGKGGRAALLNPPQPYRIESDSYWLVQRAVPYNSATGQDADLNRFLQHWCIVKDVLGPGRRLQLFQQKQLETAFADAPDTMVVYLVEFKSGPQFAPDPCENWVARELLNASVLEKETRWHLKRATAAQADVIVFPELCVPPTVAAVIADYLETEGHPHRLVIAGSFHRQCGEGWVNQALVLDHTGNEVSDWQHRKMTAVSLPKQCISEGTRRSDVLPIAATPCGLQAIVICLDLAQGLPAEEVPLKSLPLAWLWVPSLSATITPHKNAAKFCTLAQSTAAACANQLLPGSKPVKHRKPAELAGKERAPKGKQADEHHSPGGSFVSAVNCERVDAPDCYPAQVIRVTWR